jgi:hypothetical protein
MEAYSQLERAFFVGAISAICGLIQIYHFSEHCLREVLRIYYSLSVISSHQKNICY